MAAGLQLVSRMRAALSSLVIAVGIVFVGSAAQAETARSSARHKAKRPAKAAPAPAPTDDDADDASATQADAKQVAIDSRDDADGRDDRDRDLDRERDRDRGREKDRDRETARIGKAATPAPAPADHGWHVAIGPYLWASSVSANVSVGGPVSAGVDIGFIPISRHARYGAELLGEVRHGRFALYSDLMYGVVDVNGSTSVASVMVTLDGSASSLMIDGAAGYQVLGDEDAVFSLEARGGLRYQRTAINGQVSGLGITVMSPDSVNEGTDVLVGTRAVIRPTRWLSFSGVFDYGVAGASDRTWSLSGDANLRVSRHVMISGGWRTLTMERALISLAMQGPRLAVQLVF